MWSSASTRIWDRGPALFQRSTSPCLSEDLLVLIEIVDTEERIEEILPLLDDMISEGLVTIEAVQILAYRCAEGSAESGA